LSSFRPQAGNRGRLVPVLNLEPGDAAVARKTPAVCFRLRLLGKLNQRQGFAPGSVDPGDQEKHG